MNSTRFRVAVLWKGTIIQEKTFKCNQKITIGRDRKADLVLSENVLPDKKLFTLFKPNKMAGHDLFVTKGMTGQVNYNDERMSLRQCVTDNTSNTSGVNALSITDGDWGIVHLDNLVIFFQYTNAARKVAAPLLHRVNSNNIASYAFSAVAHLSFILMALFLWSESGVIERRPLSFKLWDVEAMFESIEEEEEEEEEDGAEEDLTSKQPEGEEGKFGDPDLQPELESIIPENEGRMVTEVDPKSVGLVDILSNMNNQDGNMAIANILSDRSDGQRNKMAVAMAGEGSEFVMGSGSGGLGFRGTGRGGNGLGGYGRIHGLGRIDTGAGSGTRANLGRKRARTVGRIRVGSGRSTGFCKRGDIARIVRRRSGAIRSCYQRRLQVKPALSGKITARWQIAQNGRVASASAVQDTVRDSTVTQCIMRVLRRMTFPRPEGGVCIVQWPFIFNAN